MRHNILYIRDVRPSSLHPGDEAGQSEQIPDEKVRATGAVLVLGAALGEVGPFDGDCPDDTVLIRAHHAPTGDVGTLPDPSKLPAGQRVERVGDPHKVLAVTRKSRNLGLVTSGLTPEPSRSPWTGKDGPFEGS